MDKPKEEPKRVEGRKTRSDKRIVGTAKHHQAKSDITREQFHALVKKSAQPIKDTNESGSTSDET